MHQENNMPYHCSHYEDSGWCLGNCITLFRGRQGSCNQYQKGVIQLDKGIVLSNAKLYFNSVNFMKGRLGGK